MIARAQHIMTPILASASVRYGLVSVVCALVNNLLLIVAAAAGISPLACAVGVIAPMLALGFSLQARWVFRAPATWAGFWRYSLGVLSNQPLFVVLIFFFCDVLRWPMAGAAPTATAFLFFWNFAASRWAFRARRPAP